MGAVGTDDGVSVVGTDDGVSVVGTDDGVSVVGTDDGVSVVGTEDGVSVVGTDDGVSVVGTAEGAFEGVFVGIGVGGLCGRTSAIRLNVSPVPLAGSCNQYTTCSTLRYTTLNSSHRTRRGGGAGLQVAQGDVDVGDTAAHKR